MEFLNVVTRKWNHMIGAMPCNDGKCALLIKEWSKQKFKLVWSSGKITFEFFTL